MGSSESGWKAGGSEGGGAEQEEKEKEEEDDDDDDEEEDVVRWQAPFVMGRLCARLGRHPRVVLEHLSQALRLAKV